MPGAYSVGATPPLSRGDNPAHSRFRFRGAWEGPTLATWGSPPKRGFLRSPLSGRSGHGKDGTGKIPWDSPASPRGADGEGLSLLPKVLHRPSPPLEGGAALLRVRSSAEDYTYDDEYDPQPHSPGKASTSGKSGSSGGAGGGFRRLVNKGSKFSLRTTLGLAGASTHGGTGASGSPPTSPTSLSRFSFSRDSNSIDIRHQPFVGTRGFATYPREISSPHASRVSPGVPYLTPLPSPARERTATAKGSDDEGKGSVRAKAARFLGEEIVPSGKAAKVLGMERKKTLVKKPSSTSLLVAEFPSESATPSAPIKAPPLGHNRQRSLSIPTRYTRDHLGRPTVAYLATTQESGDGDVEPWLPPTPTTPQSTSAPPIETSDYAGSSPTLTRSQSASPSPQYSPSRDSVPQTARVESFASSTFCASGIPSFYPASSTAPPEWRNSTWSSRRGSEDEGMTSPTGRGHIPPRLPKPRRLSPESIRFSAIFSGRASELFSNGSGGSSLEGETSARDSSSGAAAASQRPSLGAGTHSNGSSGGLSAPLKPMRRPALLRQGSSVSSTTGSASSPPLVASPAPPPLPPLPSPPTSAPPQPRKKPKRSDTLRSTASSHTRRSQRSHALDALEGRPRRTRNHEREEGAESTATTASASAEGIAEMERRALRVGGLAAVQDEEQGDGEELAGSERRDDQATSKTEKSRPFLDLGCSSDEEAAQRRREGAPPLPPPSSSGVTPAPLSPPNPSCATDHAAPAASTEVLPAGRAGPATTSIPAFSHSSTSSAHSRVRRRAHVPTVHLPRRPPPPAAPLPPVPPGPAQPQRKKHARHPSQASVQSSVLSLSSSEDEMDSAFPAPPRAREHAGGGAGAGAGAVAGRRMLAAGE